MCLKSSHLCTIDHVSVHVAVVGVCIVDSDSVQLGDVAKDSWTTRYEQREIMTFDMITWLLFDWQLYSRT